MSDTTSANILDPLTNLHNYPKGLKRYVTTRSQSLVSRKSVTLSTLAKQPQQQNLLVFKQSFLSGKIFISLMQRVITRHQTDGQCVFYRGYLKVSILLTWGKHKIQYAHKKVD